MKTHETSFINIIHLNQLVFFKQYNFYDFRNINRTISIKRFNISYHFESLIRSSDINSYFTLFDNDYRYLSTKFHNKVLIWLRILELYHIRYNHLFNSFSNFSILDHLQLSVIRVHNLKRLIVNQFWFQRTISNSNWLISFTKSWL